MTFAIYFFTVLPYICAIAASVLAFIIIGYFSYGYSFGYGGAPILLLSITTLFLIATHFSNYPAHLLSVTTGVEQLIPMQEEITNLASQDTMALSDYEEIQTYNDKVDELIVLRTNLEECIYGRILCDIFHAPDEDDISALRVSIQHALLLLPT